MLSWHGMRALVKGRLGCVCCTPAACPPQPNSSFVPPDSKSSLPAQPRVTLLLQICRASCCVLLFCDANESATSSSVKC